MKFIREIISGKGDSGGGKPRPDVAAPPARAPVLDLEAFSVPTTPAAPPRDGEVKTAAPPPRPWARSQNGALLSRNLTTATRQSEAAAQDSGEACDFPIAADETPDLDDMAEDDAPDPGTMAGDDGENLFGSPGDDDLPAPAGKSARDDAPEDEAGDAVRRLLAGDPGPPPDLPSFRHRARLHADPAPDPVPDSAPGPAGVTPLREPCDDPFQRLQKMSRQTPPVAESPSPFERLRDRRPMAASPEASPSPARPRTRLSPDLMAAASAEPRPQPAPEPRADPRSDAIAVPAPAAGRAARRAGRVKTRLLGFNGDDESNPFDAAAAGPAAAAAPVLYPVGWLVVAAGPGRGQSFAIFAGVSQIGRGEDQAVRLDFGDTAISRHNHAAVAYDREQRRFYLGHGGKANLVRLNGKPVLSTEELADGSRITIGETTLHFVALCGTGFDWDRNQGDDVDAAVFG